MPILGLPNFTDGGTLTPAQMNAISAALEAKFAGAIVSGDMSWPFVVGGDINFGKYSILGLAQFWNQYNLAERAANGDSITDVLTDIAADGGGVVVIPGNTTYVLPDAGAAIPSNVLLIGHGPSSVLEISDTASDNMLRIDSGISNAGLSNLTLRGNSSVNHAHLELTSCSQVLLNDVYFDTHNASAFIEATSATNVTMDRCRMTGESNTTAQTQVEITTCTDWNVTNCRFLEWTNRAIDINCQRGTFARNKFWRNGGADVMSATHSIEIDNTGSYNNVIFIGNQVGDDNSSDVRGILLGQSGLIMSRNKLNISSSSPALWGRLTRGVITHNQITATTGDGVIIGSDAGTETAVGSRNVLTSGLNTINSNYISTPKAGLALVFPAAGSVSSVMKGNIVSAGPTYGAFEIWNGGADPTTKTARLVCVSNYCYGSTGMRTYVGMGYGSTRGCRIGKSANARVVFTNNVSPGTLIGDTANYDFVNSDGAATEYSVAKNNILA